MQQKQEINIPTVIISIDFMTFSELIHVDETHILLREVTRYILGLICDMSWIFTAE